MPMDRRRVLTGSLASSLVSGPVLAADRFQGGRAGDRKTVSGIALIWAPAGRFIMGSPAGEPERRADDTQVEVTLTRGFWIGQYAVTQKTWREVMGAMPGELSAGAGEAFPVYNMSWFEAEDFCARLTERERGAGRLPTNWAFRLPTEAQWEYAARAGTTTATFFGDKLSSRQANFRGDHPYNGAEAGPVLGRTAPVGSYPANPWGLFDVNGNVFEWCRDWYYARYPGGTDPDLHDAEAGAAINRTRTVSRSRRGGCWSDEGWACRTGFRLKYEPERRADHIGLRLVAVEV